MFYNCLSRGYVICYACLAWSLGQIAFPLVGQAPIGYGY